MTRDPKRELLHLQAAFESGSQILEEVRGALEARPDVYVEVTPSQLAELDESCRMPERKSAKGLAVVNAIRC